MNKTTLILGVLLAVGITGTAGAQTTKPKTQTSTSTPAPSTKGSELVDGSNAQTILDLARGHGDATMEKQKNGDPRIAGETGGVKYAIYFMNCTNNTDCEDLNFYAGFADLKPKIDLINAWNRDKRFGKAYLDKDNDAVVEMDFNLEHGVSSDNLDAAFTVWDLVVDQYVTHIGFKKD